MAGRSSFEALRSLVSRCGKRFGFRSHDSVRSGAPCGGTCKIPAMRALCFVVVFTAVVGDIGCDSGKEPNPEIDAAVEIDAAAGCQPTVLLVGGTDVVAQGWTLIMQSPASITYVQDYVRLQTSTATNARTSGQLLLQRAGALEAGKPFKLQGVMLVESVNPHNTLDSAAAILGSFTPTVGNSTDRAEMIYLDSGKIGWADDSQSFTVSVTNNAYHTYELSVGADNVAHVSIDGVQALMRTGFASNGTIAIGDQTNDPNVDSTLRIRSVTKLCL